MLQVEMSTWGQTAGDLREPALNAPHPRTRKRFMALFEIAEGSRPTGLTLLMYLSGYGWSSHPNPPN